MVVVVVVVLVVAVIVLLIVPTADIYFSLYINLSLHNLELKNTNFFVICPDVMDNFGSIQK